MHVECTHYFFKKGIAVLIITGKFSRSTRKSIGCLRIRRKIKDTGHRDNLADFRTVVSGSEPRSADREFAAGQLRPKHPIDTELNKLKTIEPIWILESTTRLQAQSTAAWPVSASARTSASGRPPAPDCLDTRVIFSNFFPKGRFNRKCKKHQQ